VKKWLVSILVLAVLAASGGLIWEARTAYKGFPGSALVTIPAGSSASEAAAILAARGVIHHRAPFLTLYALGRERSKRENTFSTARSARVRFIGRLCAARFTTTWS